MKVPKIKTEKGPQPITIVPNKDLVSVFLSCCGDAPEAEYVRLLQYAEPDSDAAGKILRKALTAGREFFAYYPGLEGSKEPADTALFCGSIPDGSLYLL